MADPRRLRIIEALKARAERITVANGFRTNAGQQVLLNELPAFGPDDAEIAIVMLVQEDQISDKQVGKISIVLPVDFVALVKPDVEEPWVIAEQVLADIKEAVELEDRSLGGLLSGGLNNPEGLMRGTTEVYPRQTGSEVAGLLVSYGCHYRESWGRPEA